MRTVRAAPLNRLRRTPAVAVLIVLIVLIALWYVQPLLLRRKAVETST